MIRAFKGIRPAIDPTAWIEESAQIVGDVTIGRDASVWFNAVVRGDVHFIRIGERTNIQDGTVVHARKAEIPTIVGNDVTVGHSAVLHACTIRDRCLIGMGAIVLDGAEIGEETIVGAGAVVTMGTKVPPRSLVLGLPAKVVRPVTDEEVRSILRSAENYLGYVREYRGGTP